jgi:signal transduction histidine kinase
VSGTSREAPRESGEVPRGPADPGRGGPDHPGLVPGVLRRPREEGPRLDPWRRVHRSGRDWVVDVLAVVLAALAGLVFVAGDPARSDSSTAWVDVSLGVVCVAAVWLRRRFPLEVALLSGLAGAVSTSAGGAAMVGMFTVALHRRAALAIAIGIVNCVSAAVFFAWRPQTIFGSEPEPTPFWVALGFICAINAVVVVWGMLVRSRRQLVLSLRERAERAEGEQRLRSDQARAAERARIAREMHDVVAHRVSLVALHAGALELRPDLPPEEIARTAALIRTTARTALEELRSVVGVLRGPGEDGAEAAPQTPQPTLDDITRLVEESRRAGVRVDLTLDVREAETAPGPLGRDAYRIVQEALTNVHKHARGAATVVSVTGGPSEGLVVAVRNRLPAASARSLLPGAGAGLLGLTERVDLSGGTLRHGRTTDGDFEVVAELRWPR